jgi:molybdopterin-guanine dinucleotide biosynthesis protein A
MIDHVYARLAPQCDVVVLSGFDAYGLGIPVVCDVADARRGPVAGIFSVARWAQAHAPGAAGFTTAPVDAPLLPLDLVQRLMEDGTAIAADETGDHPTFAYWPLAALHRVEAEAFKRTSLSLRALAALCGARVEHWAGAGAFLNFNRPEDLTTKT